jgi:hypothetical protein
MLFLPMRRIVRKAAKHMMMKAATMMLEASDDLD